MITLYAGGTVPIALPYNVIASVGFDGAHRTKVEGFALTSYSVSDDYTDLLIQTRNGDVAIFRMKGIDPNAVRGRIASHLATARVPIL